MIKQSQWELAIFYFSFIFLLPLFWYFREKSWLEDTKKKIQEKQKEIEQKNQELPKLWQQLNLHYPIEIGIDTNPAFNLNNYQKAIDFIWDQPKPENLDSEEALTIKDMDQRVAFTNFLTEIKQNIAEYNSDVVLFNRSLRKWPGRVIGANLYYQLANLIESPE